MQLDWTQMMVWSFILRLDLSIHYHLLVKAYIRKGLCHCKTGELKASSEAYHKVI